VIRVEKRSRGGETDFEGSPDLWCDRAGSAGADDSQEVAMNEQKTSEVVRSTVGVGTLERGVFRLGSSMVNWYAVEDGGRLTIIDAGLPKHAETLEADLRSVGRELSDIEAVVLTHAHPDHIGVAGFLRARGVPVYVHREDAGMLANRGRPPEGKPERSMLAYAGHATMWRLMAHLVRGGLLHLPKIDDPVVFEDGEVLDVPGHPRVVHTPGHSDGHCALVLDERGVLFAGDALCTWNPLTGRVGPQLAPAAFAISTEQATRSLEAIERIDCDLVLPGHGEPWSDGAASAVAQARAAGRS
jgi:glyoxylase-like metal-dependent hydrolase (beta-lactamase superfamily II)